MGGDGIEKLCVCGGGSSKFWENSCTKENDSFLLIRDMAKVFFRDG